VPAWTDDRDETPHGRGATDVAHFLLGYLWADLGTQWLATWAAVFLVAQAVQLHNGGWGRAAWQDALFDCAVTATGAALALADLERTTTGLAALVTMGALYGWRVRKILLGESR
jgi:hypothetical protein